MRILSLNPTERDEAGGAAGATIRLNAHLRELGHEVDELFYADLVGIRNKSLGLDLMPATAARSLRRTARRYDVIDAVGHSGALLFRVLGKHRPLCIARTAGLEHTDYIEERRSADADGRRISLKTRLHHGVLRLRSVESAVRAADGFVAPLAGDADFVVRQGWKTSDQVIATGWGTTPEALRARRSRSQPWRGRLIWCGTLIERKGWSDFARAFETAWAELGLTLDILGSRLPIDAPLPGISQASRARIQVHPLLDRARQFEIMAAGDLFVSTSVSEGWHFALQEAMAIGLPCAATRTGLLLEIPNWHEMVFPLPKRAAAGVADVFRQAADDPSAFAERAERARQRQRSLTWAYVAAKTAEWMSHRLRST
ncbi:MAG TPA: glycosyltransferase family 4 protein [Solirubrobacteraceae bacterium]